MASVSSIRSKEWRAKRKDDAEYWEQERKRKRKARQSCSEEKKQHDRELSKKRQKRFRERKKSAKCNVTFLPLDISTVNDGGGVPAISDDVRSSGEFGILSVSNPNTFHVSMDTDLDKGPGDSVCESAEIEEEGGPVFLYNVDGNNWHKKSKPLTEQCGNKGAEGMASISVTGGEGREAYFKRIQASLSEVEDFDLLQMKCNEFSHQIEEMYPIENLPTLDVTGYQLDNVASSLYPHEDAPDDFVPIRTVGDGNCLPRVGSLFAFGNEKHHNEIRVRMFIELCRYEHYYLDDSYLKRGTEQGLVNISKTLALFSDVFVPHEEDGVRLAFRQYVKNILKTNSFNGMWSIFALSSVLGVQALSIYPSYGGYNVRPDLHRLVMPRVFRQEKSKTVHIMWTSTHGKQVEPKSWTPNHFVAVLPTLDRRPTPRENDDLPMQHEQSGSQPITDSIRGSEPIESLSSNFDASVESPTTHFLNSVCTRDATIVPNDKADSRTTVLAPTDHMNIGNPTRVNNTFLSHLDERNPSKDMIDQHGAMDLRSEDRCPLHSKEELLYLCTTCGALPVCYKCHLESHQQHTFADLKMCLAANERIYLQKITKKHEENLKNKIKQQKQDHVENMESIDRKIETTFEYYKGQLAKWKHLMHETKSKSDQKVIDRMQVLESELRDTDAFAAKACHYLKSLPISKRLSVMTAEPQPENISKSHPRLHLLFRAGPDTSLDQFGTLAEIPYHDELSKNDQWFCAEATAVEFPNKQRVNAIPTVSTFNDQYPTYTRPETLRQHGGSQTIHQQHREQITFNPEESGLSLQPTDSAVNNTMLWPRVFTASSEMEHDTCTQGTKHKTTLGLEYRQSGQENVNLVKSDSNNTDNDTLCVRGNDLSVDVSVKRTMRDITHKITIPKRYWYLDVFRSVGNKLYAWIFFNGTRVLQINNDGNQHNNINLKSRCVNDVCVSAIDSTVWFVCRNGRVRCVSPTGTVKTKFTINARPLLLCVTCSGDVLVLDYNRLTLYTVSGEVVHSTECSNEAWVIRECSQTRNIMACTLDYPGIIALYDNRLKKKLSIEGGTITYPDGHTSDVGYDMQHVNDVCFDKEGNILISCDSGHVILIDHTNGRYIRTVLSDCIGLWRMDVDDEGVMWCLCIDGEVKCFHL